MASGIRLLYSVVFPSLFNTGGDFQLSSPQRGKPWPPAIAAVANSQGKQRKREIQTPLMLGYMQVGTWNLAYSSNVFDVIF
jgi:hypothetical protein